LQPLGCSPLTGPPWAPAPDFTCRSTVLKTKRPWAELCKRLTLVDVRPLVKPGQRAVRLADGTALALHWGTVRGCYGGEKPGRALLLICPSCRHNSRVLHRPPGRPWGCWSCTPLSRASHRRSGARSGKPKPLSWRRAQIAAQQQHCAQLLGLAHWPPKQLLWRREDVLLWPRRPGAPRLSAARGEALARRLDILELMWWSLPDAAAIAAGCQRFGVPPLLSGEDRGGLNQFVEYQLAATGWAVRRRRTDPRQQNARKQKGTGGTDPAA